MNAHALIPRRVLWWRQHAHELEAREARAQVTLGEAQQLAASLRAHRKENHFGEAFHEALRARP